MTTTIYMPMLNEGTEVWRPIEAECISENIFLIKGPQPNNEDWTFAPGTTVVTKINRFVNGAYGIVAVAIFK